MQAGWLFEKRVVQQNGEKHRAWFNIDNGNDKVPNGTGAEGLQRGDGTE